MKINFILPPMPFLGDPLKNAPLGVLYLAAVLRDKKYDVAVCDLRDQKMNTATIESIDSADVFAFSSTTPEYTNCRLIAHRLKTKYSNAKFIIGGVHATSSKPMIDSVFDYVGFGEAEGYIEQMINHTQSQRTYFFPKKTTDLDKLPFPARDLLPNFISHTLVEKDHPATTITASRGCAYDCPFCSSKLIWNKKIRFRNPKLVGEEISHLQKKYGINHFRFHDDGFTTATDKWLNEMCQVMKDTGAKWRINARINKMNSRRLKLLADAGCIDIGYGVESVEQLVLDRCNKKITVSQIKDVIKKTKQHGIKTRVFLIIGLPGQTEATLDKTISFIKDTHPDSVDLSTLVPYPGTAYFEHPEKYGFKIPDKRSYDDFIFTIGLYENEVDRDFLFIHDKLSNEQLKYIRKQLLSYIVKHNMDMNR